MRNAAIISAVQIKTIAAESDSLCCPANIVMEV